MTRSGLRKTPRDAGENEKTQCEGKGTLPPATSSHLTFGFSVTIAEPSAPRIFAFSSSSRFLPSFPPLGFALVSSGELTGFAFLVAFSESMSFFSSSARSRYSQNFAFIVWCIIGFFSYLRYIVKWSSAPMYSLKACG